MATSSVLSHVWVRALAPLVLLLLPLLSHPVAAGDMSVHQPAMSRDSSWSVLDGTIFSGEYGFVGEEASGQDRWLFEKGHFLSEGCRECGFPESPYWVSFDQDKTDFRAQSRCPVTDASISWRGTIKDGRIEGVFTWTRERWYWTIEREFWFKGDVVETAADETAAIQ